MNNTCSWVGDDPLMVKYHDREWGVPLHDDRNLFELLVLESAQAGLSWQTVLNKRENYRKAFDDFDFNKVAAYDDSKVEELMHNSGIIRNRKKILSSIKNARSFIEIRTEFGSFDTYIWKFVNYRPIRNSFRSPDELPASTELSEMISKDLKKRGFSFVGPTIIYAFMQSAGLVNDHVVSCFRYSQCG